jgi:PAS domain S-box-containing protein
LAVILVVDDHPVNRDFLATLLGCPGHTVLEASDGAKALVIARERHPDLVITDLVMPVMDGYEFVRELRGDPSLAATRVIFYTANYLRDEVEPMAAALGVRHVVSKPADPPALLALAEEALKEAAAELVRPMPEAAHKEYLRTLSGKLADKVRELEAAQASLTGSEERFRSLAESCPIGIFSLDSSGRVTYRNLRLKEICGQPADRASAVAWTDVLHPDDRERVVAMMSAAVEAGAPYRGRARLLWPTGELRWAEIRATPVPGDDGGLAYVGTMEDLTEAVQAQSQREELQAELHAQRAEARFRGLIDAAPDAMVCVDSAGVIVLVNAQTERLFGYRREELAGQPVEILVPDAIKAGHPVHRAGYLADPRPRVMGEGLELTARRRDGSTFRCEISLSTSDTGEGMLVMAAVRDVRERLELQAERERLKTQAERDRLERQLHQSQRLESLGQLAGGVAHDFNNLLAVISNYAAFVAEDVASKAPQEEWRAVREDIGQIQRAAERAAGLTHQLLAFARRDVVQPRALNLNHVIEGVEQLLLRTLGEHVELSTGLAAGLRPVLADPGQIEQILVNLAVNARDAMPGGGKLMVDTAGTNIDADHAGLSPGRYVSLTVSDTGTGMPQDVIDHAFEPFFTTKPKGEGTGLGLATVYGIVTQLGGGVQIFSKPALGTTFTILLPETSQPAQETPPTPSTAFGGASETVLVVEDEPAMREVTRRILTRHGYQVLTASNGRDAVEVAAAWTGNLDVLVTDVIMPYMLGKEAAEQIRTLHPAIKVLFMSGYTQGILDTQGGLEAGINLIEKPFTEASLLAKLSEIISAHT